MEPKNTINDKSQLVLNILLIVSGFSALFYLVGYLNYLVYYNTLGIYSRFLDFSYSEYVTNGIMVNLSLLTFLLPSVLFFLRLFNLKNMKDQVSKIMSVVAREKLPKQKVGDLQVLLDRIGKSENDLIDIFWKQCFIPLVVSILAGLILAIIMFLNKNILLLPVVSFEVQMLINLIILYLIKRVVKSKKAVDVVFFAVIPVIIFLTLFLLPMTTGYISARQKRTTMNFDSYTIVMDKGEKIESAKFIYFGKDTYFFLIKDTLNIISKSEVTKLEKL